MSEQKYCMIVNSLMLQIKAGGIKSGNRLPSIRDISKLYDCSKATAVRAYQELEKKHIIYSFAHSYNRLQ